MEGSLVRSRFIAVASAALVASAWLACGTDAAPVPAATADAGVDAPSFGLGDGAAACRTVGAGCLSASECCVAACVGSVCGGRADGGDVRACNPSGGASSRRTGLA